MQPLVDTAPSEEVIAGTPQSAVTEAVPRAALISEALGLHPSVTDTPVMIIVGGFGAVAQVTVRKVVAVLPQASTAVNVLVRVVLQLVVDSGPSLEVTVVTLHASVAVAEPRAASISGAVELQPNVVVVPVAVMVGDVRSTTLIVAGDSIHPAIVLAVPAGVVPQTALVTYLVLIL